MKTRTHKTINQYSYPQLARFKPAKAPGQFSFGTGGQFSIGANTVISFLSFIHATGQR
jgi:hypothetical protein